jgi:hypothetical protein
VSGFLTSTLRRQLATKSTEVRRHLRPAIGVVWCADGFIAARHTLVLLAATVAVVAFGAFLFRPVCVPIASAALQEFNVPIEQRTDRDFYLPVFQYRDGRWCQCKTWLSRQLFF